MENKAKRNTSLVTIISTWMKIIASVYILQISESKVKQSWQNIILLREKIWSRSNQSEN